MTESGEVLPLGHPLYESIRVLCALQIDFDEIEFVTLPAEDPDVPGDLAVTGTLENRLADEVSLVLWRGRRGREPGSLWLRIETGDPGEGRSEVQELDPDVPGLGLRITDDLDVDELARAAEVLHQLLTAGEATHAGLDSAAASLNLEQLDEAVQDGFDDKEDAGEDADGPEDDSELALHSYAAASGFAALWFSAEHMDGYEVFATRAILPTVDGDVKLAAWITPRNGAGDDTEYTFMLEVNGSLQRMPLQPGDQLFLPWGPGIPREQVRLALQYLKPLHLHAFELYREHLDGFRGELTDALEVLAANALEGGDPLPLDVLLPDGSDIHGQHLTGASWHGQLEEFTRLCRLGLLGSVVVEESPRGSGLNARAAILDPVTGQEIPLQVYWQLVEGADEPVHMFTAGTSTRPAHGGDPMHGELLSGFPQASREHVLHAIDHLHDLAELAAGIAAAKDADTTAMLTSEGINSDAADIVLGQMQAEALEDALAAINGIARLYTGSHADRDVRDS